MGSWEMGEGRGEVHRKEGGVGDDLIKLRSLKTSDTEGRP